MSDLDIGIPFNDAPPRGRAARGRRRRQRGRERRRSMIAFIVMILVFGLLAGGAWYGYGKVKDFFTPPDYAGQGTGSVTVEIEEDSTISDIANVLYKNDVVQSAKAFVNASKDEPRATTIQHGTYGMRKQMSAAAALALMLDPASKSFKKFQVIEGRAVKEFLPVIAKQTGIPLADFEAAAKDPAALGVPEWAKSKTGQLTLEGFLFPDTYPVGAKDDAKTILSKMVAQTIKVMEQDGFMEAAAAIGRSPLELLTVASLIENEGIEADFKKVSRVVYNRLSRTDYLKYLQFDSTTQYWLIQTGKGRKAKLTDVDLKNSQNNYSTDLDMVAGLPPTPIGNPGKAALDAAARPEPGNWVYFVVTSKDGNSSFAATLEEHNANVRKCKKIKIC